MSNSDVDITYKVRGWTVTKLVAASTLGVLYLVLALGGSTISAVTGIPLTSAFINIFVSGAMYTLGILLVRQFGTAAIMGIIYATLAIPLPLYGTPGFAPKIIIGLLGGLSGDIAFLLFHRKIQLAALIVGGTTQITLTLLIIGLGAAFKIPGIEKTIELFLKPIPLIAAFILGAIAGWIGYKIYNKISNRSIVKRIQASGTGKSV